MRQFILSPENCIDPALLGGKARALFDLRSKSIHIPQWFVVSPEAFEASLPPELQKDWNELTEESITPFFDRVVLSNELVQTITQATKMVAGARDSLAVRSSARGEDGSEHSFAGQLESFLNVPVSEVANHVLRVWRSGFDSRVWTYRREKGLTIRPDLPAVLVQRMVEPSVSGVAFGADPVTGRRSIAVVSGVYGLGTALVGGDVDADTFHVDRTGKIVDRKIASKKVFHIRCNDKAGVMVADIPSDKSQRPCLSDDEIKDIAELARQLAAARGTPQDIEWALSEGVLYLLQSRPITSLARVPDPDGNLVIWDNANIAESYGGTTTPLTFSFVCRIYEEVYRQFCLILGVSAQKVEDNAEVFRSMLGYIQGRIYYNLLGWYGVLSLLPGFAVNRRFMEQMMGVKEELPKELEERFTKASLGAKIQDALALVRTLLGLVVHLILLPISIRRFYARLNDALGTLPVPPSEMRTDELADYYAKLEGKLIKKWDAPLVNDFFAMIFYGVLRSLCRSWLQDESGTLQNDLVAGEGCIISAEPARRIGAIAQLVAKDNELCRCLRECNRTVIESQLAHHPDIQQQFDSYLEKFSDRCLEELKLESETLADDPTVLYRTVGQYALALKEGRSSSTAASREERIRDIENKIRKSFERSPFKKAFFYFVSNQARKRVRDRENLRFERTRLFGRVRRVFLEIGRRLTESKSLDNARDVFFLELNEVLGFIKGTATTADLKSIVAVRKQELERYKNILPPPDRFETRGAVHLSPLSTPQKQAASQATEGDLRGIGCSPGIVQGPVRVVTDPRGVELTRGEILVAPRTDPGWIMLFPVAIGLLVEHGSLLSHSAIVSRELGLPAVVAIPGLLASLKDGDWVELDGTTGTVKRISKESS
jgi:phosphohistidine swiveling domain-containing protein